MHAFFLTYFEIIQFLYNTLGFRDSIRSFYLTAAIARVAVFASPPTGFLNPSKYDE